MAATVAVANRAAAPIVIDLPAGAYPLEAVHRATYALMARIDLRIISMDGSVVCEAHPLVAGLDPDAIELMVRREITDQALRMTIEARTEGYRDLILGLAFSRTGLQDG